MNIIKTILIFLLTNFLLHGKEDKLDVANEEINEKTVYHFSISMASGYLTETLLEEASKLSDAEKVIYATLPIISVGIAKEFHDDAGERTDMIANIVGAFSGAYLSHYLHMRYFFEVEHSKTDLEEKTKLNIGYRF